MQQWARARTDLMPTPSFQNATLGPFGGAARLNLRVQAAALPAGDITSEGAGASKADQDEPLRAGRERPHSEAGLIRARRRIPSWFILGARTVGG